MDNRGDERILETIVGREHVFDGLILHIDHLTAKLPNGKLAKREVAMHGTDREARCRACYRLRFEETAREAAARGFDTISTTLTISPYQLTNAILEELEAAAERHGLKVDARDFRDRYREATRRSREKGMYRQNYCGCRFSIAEAEEQRKAAKRKRDEEKRLRHVALLCMAAEGIRTQK